MIRILLADQHRLVGVALEAMLGQEADIEVAAVLTDAASVLDRVGQLAVDLVLLEAALPAADPVTITRRIRAELPDVAVMFLSSSGNAAELQQVMRSGARGYLCKNSTQDTLLSAIRQVAAGHQYFDPDVLMNALTPRGHGSMLSARELMALRLVANGLSNKEVAARLCLSPGTVRNYISSVITKTSARNRTDAVRIARECAWL